MSEDLDVKFSLGGPDSPTESVANSMDGSVVERKTGGRRKIPIEFIDDKSRRHITFSKRKAGIMKKAYELSTLTGTQVLLLVASETGHVYTFATPKLQPLITKPEGKNLIQACLNAPDVPLDYGSAPAQQQQGMEYPAGPPAVGPYVPADLSQLQQNPGHHLDPAGFPHYAPTAFPNGTEPFQHDPSTYPIGNENPP
ncbi:hypothetical protein, variant [Sphaeroforma arctica JP610]|uniref:MADS-box domain-containing protein n=1 Tax=Sphaeroforma arctica JP610 TaxID=667725 RepID=A0A0L0FVY7_9EUKA|nr:hypothetical protein, variant [Sphaeroforma arctica JP610]KNC81010.1 hypothetical protein, variant [Sphaeroforma arctica JP610]|eukprot:XP_014154912.1 hypothetical protein, variant [Sphaeroforma arctica JP610]